MMSAVEIIPANDRYEDVLSLMKEYVAWLMMNDDKMKEVLANQQTSFYPPEYCFTGISVLIHIMK